MLYMHYCRGCKRIHILNGHKVNCPACPSPINELSISYGDYVAMDLQAREELLARCGNDEQLEEITVLYRLHRYSKWYKDSKKEQNNDSADSSL